MLQCYDQGTGTILYLDRSTINDENPRILQTITLLNTKFVEIEYAKGIGELIALSSTNQIGAKASVIHLFKQYNLLGWKKSFDINKFLGDDTFAFR